MERTGGRRFGHAELARLAWIWSWDGTSTSGETSQKAGPSTAKAEENPFLVGSDTEVVDRVSGLSYLITTTRTIDSHGRKVWTYGLGIALDLKPGETRPLLRGGGQGDGGVGSKGQGGGMGAVGRWNVGGEMREEVVREKLEQWVQMHGGYEVSLGFSWK